MPLGQFSSHREAQAGPSLTLRRIERFEDPRPAIDRDARPVILHDDLNRPAAKTLGGFDCYGTGKYLDDK